MNDEFGKLEEVVPQTWAEALDKYPWLKNVCEPHEWDNNTTAENAAMILKRGAFPKEATPDMIEVAVKDAVENGLFPRYDSIEEVGRRYQCMASALNAALKVANGEHPDVPMGSKAVIYHEDDGEPG